MESTSSLPKQATDKQQPIVLSNSLQHVLPYIMLAFVLWVGCFYGLGAAGIFDRDEGLYTTASRQMLDSGDWIVPRIGSEVRFAKPPLTYWLQAPFIFLLGATPVAARFPSALMAALTAIALFWWAKRHGAERVGWLAAIIYALSPLTMIEARQAITDSLLTFCCTLTIIGWIEGYRGNHKAYLLMAVGAGLATLTKGVIGFLLPGVVLILWPLLRRELPKLRQVPWLSMIFILLIIVIPWHLAMWQATGQRFIDEYLIQNHFDRFRGAKYGHHQPFWFYIPMLLIGMFPWSVFVPLSWWQNYQAVRQQKDASGEQSTVDESSVIPHKNDKLNTMLAMWGLWALIVIGFFSSSKSKLPEYILPAFPAFALLIAARLVSLWQVKRGLKKWEGGLFGFVGMVLGSAFLAVGITGWRLSTHPVATMWGKKITSRFLDIATTMAPLGLALGALFILGSILVLVRWSTTSRVTGTVIAMNLLFIVLTVHLGLMPWSQYAIEPLHNLGRQSLPALERGEPLVIYKLRPTRTSLRFVVGHARLVTETDKASDLQQVINSNGKGTILTTRETKLPPLSCAPQQIEEARQWVLWGCN